MTPVLVCMCLLACDMVQLHEFGRDDAMVQKNISLHGYIAPRHNKGVIFIEKGAFGVSMIPDNNGIMIIIYSYCAFLVSILIFKNKKALIFTY